MSAYPHDFGPHGSRYDCALCGGVQAALSPRWDCPAALRARVEELERERDAIAASAGRVFGAACERLDAHEAPGVTLAERIDGLARQRDEAREGHDYLSRLVGQALVASSMAPGETLADPVPHALTTAVERLRAQRDEARRLLDQANREIAVVTGGNEENDDE